MSLQSEAIRYWQMGQYDTVDIAAKLKASEAEVYRAIASRGPLPTDAQFKPKPRPAKKLQSGARLTAAERHVAEGYANNISATDIARNAGISVASVPVIASNIGAKRPKPVKPVKARPRPPYAGYDRTELRWGGKTVTGALRP